MVSLSTSAEQSSSLGEGRAGWRDSQELRGAKSSADRIIDPIPNIFIKGDHFELDRSESRHAPTRVLNTKSRADTLEALYLPDRLTDSMTRSRLKLPGFWRGGNSRKLCSHCATKETAGATMNIRSMYQRW
jgi:hypothetical protein